MQLPLLARLAEALAARDITALRFDYGGVGESEGPPVAIGATMQQFWATGSAPDDPVHVEEAAAAREWLVCHAGGETALIGYSFGSYVATRIHDDGTAAMVMIAPTVARHDYSAFHNEHTPTLVVYGNGDFATSDDEMQRWTARLTGPTRIRHFMTGDHFFRGMETDVAQVAADFVEQTCCTAEETPQ
jgi:alpha/beta superfamily hydrolase